MKPLKISNYRVIKFLKNSKKKNEFSERIPKKRKILAFHS